MRSAAPTFLARPTMKRILFGLAALALASCASTPDANRAKPVIFNKAVAAVHSAALHALAETGFEVQKDEPNYVEGFRPRRWGVVTMGSGGETLGVWIEPDGPNATAVKVDTAKSFVGIVAQKAWNDEVLAAMRRE